ncbi:WD40 repeat domain-containing protein [Vairimorpha necatrix]|uniref:WD40 repeat domain-containing protein n=1 Tax=Vairimorpha necatrix TaxID=6039 RepID=A0AAX4J8X8_9MICR
MFKTIKGDFELVNGFSTNLLLEILPGKIHTTIYKDNFIFVIFSNTTICLINKPDYLIVKLYEGHDEQISTVKFSDTFIYAHFSNGNLWRTKFADLSYELVKESVDFFSVNSEDKILYLDKTGQIFVNEELFDNLQFNVKHISLVGNDICVVYNDKIKWKEKEIPCHGFKFAHDKFVVDSKGIYNLEEETFMKIKNVDEIKVKEEGVYFRKSEKWYKIKQ